MVTVNLTSLESCIQTAHDAGCPQDQVERFLSAGYVPTPHQWDFHALARQCDVWPTGWGQPELALGGTRGSAKTHAVAAQVILDDSNRCASLKGLFLRKTAKAAAESFQDIVSKIVAHIPHQLNSERITLPNGSRALIGGYENEDDIDKYLGIEYDWIDIEEGTQLSGSKTQKLLGSLRTSRSDWRPRLYNTTNPGGPGHLDYKTRYVEPHRDGTETQTNRRYLHYTYKDNPFIDASYKAYLEGLTGDLAKAWRDGDWDVFQGQAFDTWKYDRHVIKIMPDGWDRWVKWRSVDWGFSNPWCVGWFTRNPDNGRIIQYREAYQTHLTDKQQARTILDMTPPAERITITYADPSMWSPKNMQGIVSSTADEYLTEGVPLTRADNDRLGGKRKLDRLLEPLPDGLPGIQFYVTCSNLIRTLPALSRDSINVEDVDTKQEDHPFDMVKYALTQAREYHPEPVRNVRPHPMTQLKGIL